VVRQSMAVRPQSQRRRLEERLVGRFPRVIAFLARATWRFSPRSRLRQVLVRRTMRLCLEATNRGDVWPFAFYHPNGESIFPPQIATLELNLGLAVLKSASASNGGGTPSGARSRSTPKRSSTLATACW
jgi:hypothetical protein